MSFILHFFFVWFISCGLYASNRFPMLHRFPDRSLGKSSRKSEGIYSRKHRALCYAREQS